MKRNEKGMTAIEVLIALLIISLIVASSFQFYEVYQSKMTRFGENNTAKNLAISALETQYELTNLGLSTTGTVYSTTTKVKRVAYKVTVTRTNKTGLIGHYSSEIPFYELTSTVSWRNKDIEVSAYVSAK